LNESGSAFKYSLFLLNTMSEINNNIELIKYLSNFITENRLNLFEKLIGLRTRYFTIVLEDIFQPHNSNAVLRTCDCFGIQDVHIIENQNSYKINPDVAVGSAQWLTLYHYNSEKNNTPAAIKSLREKGYRIVATSPHSHSTRLEDFDVEKGPFALFFGSELPGLSNDVLDNADEHLAIPMYGFTESLNISVSAAICIHFLAYRLRNKHFSFGLSENEKNELFVSWLKTSIKHSDKIISDYYNKKAKG